MCLGDPPVPPPPVGEPSTTTLPPQAKSSDSDATGAFRMMGLRTAGMRRPFHACSPAGLYSTRIGTSAWTGEAPPEPPPPVVPEPDSAVASTESTPDHGGTAEKNTVT